MALTAVASPMRYSVVVLPMLPLGAPVGVVVVRDLAPTAVMRDLRARLERHLTRVMSRPATRSSLFLYRVDLPLTAFPGQTSWRFMSTMPLSQLFYGLGYPAPVGLADDVPIRDGLGSAGGLLMTPGEPIRVVHVIAEIVDGNVGWPPRRYSPLRRLLSQVDPDGFAQLCQFLSSPPEPIPRDPPGGPVSAATVPQSAPRTYPQAPPFYLNHVPVRAQLTLPKNKMFVRPVFGKLLDESLRDLSTKKRFVYVAATAGAGKTAFLWFVLYALCRRGRTRCGTFLAPPMDIVLDVPGLFVLIDTAGQVFTGPRHECFRIELMKKETLYLVDLAHGDHGELLTSPSGWVNALGHDVTSLDGHASRILVALPRRRVEDRACRFRAYAVKLLPPWKRCELELCRRACFPALDATVLTARVQLWGLQPYFTLAMDPATGVGEERLAAIVHNAAWLECIGDIAENNWIRYTCVESDDATRLLVLYPPPRDEFHGCAFRRFVWWQFCWCSSAVCATNEECYGYI